MNSRARLAFAAMSVIWGVPYLFIKIAVDDGISPAVVAWGRVTLAAALLLALAARAGTLRSLRGNMRWIAAFAFCEIAVPFPLIAAGEQHLPSSLTAILLATIPLIIAVLALRLDVSERPTRLRLLGLVIGFAGVVALVGLDVSRRPGELLGVAAVLTAAAGYAVGPFIIKRHLGVLDPRAMLGASLAIASLLLLVPAAFTAPTRAPAAGGVAAIVVLGLLCTALAFVVYNVLIAEAGPSRASVITYVNPVVAVALGVALRGESPGAGAIAGLLLILAGSWLSTGGTPPRLRLARSGTRAVAATTASGGVSSGRTARASRALLAGERP
jgi:drug/metabolite transporter (DMT)-like permease